MNLAMDSLWIFDTVEWNHVSNKNRHENSFKIHDQIHFKITPKFTPKYMTKFIPFMTKFIPKFMIKFIPKFMTRFTPYKNKYFSFLGETEKVHRHGAQERQVPVSKKRPLLYRAKNSEMYIEREREESEMHSITESRVYLQTYVCLCALKHCFF